MTHFKSRLEFRLSIARKEDLETVNKKFNKYMQDYDNLDEPTICDKVHNREAFYDYMNYKSKYQREKHE